MAINRLGKCIRHHRYFCCECRYGKSPDKETIKTMRVINSYEFIDTRWLGLTKTNNGRELWVK